MRECDFLKLKHFNKNTKDYKGRILFTDEVIKNTQFEIIKLLDDILKTMNIYDKISIMHVTKEMLKRHGAREEDTEEFIDYGLSIKGIETAAIIKEREDGTLKVSLRSKNNIPVQELATKYGGGGHRTASGFSIERDIEEFKKELKEELEKLVAHYNH